MPAYPTHAFFAHLALLSLGENRHPLAAVALRHAGMFRIAGVAGCDIQCMPYQVCRHCDAPYRHNQRDSRKCLRCGEVALEDFSFTTADGRRLKRVDVERDYYRNTHLVLGRRILPYGVAPGVPPGPPEQPFPEQVVRHLANVLRDGPKLARTAASLDRYYAFTLGWFAHVVSDALFKGVYPHSVRVRFFGQQYHLSMLPAAETLTMTDISHDFGVHWPAWHDQLLNDEPDGGALRHLAMGNPPEHYDPRYWTAQFGPPDPKIGLVLDALWPINRQWFHAMYLTPDYTAASPVLDARPLSEVAGWTFNALDLGAVRAHAITSGWYLTFVRGIEIYGRVVEEATRAAGISGNLAERSTPVPPAALAINYGRWAAIVGDSAAAPPPQPGWGSRLEVDPVAAAMLTRSSGRNIRLTVSEPATTYQQRVADALRRRMRIAEPAALEIVIGPPWFNARAAALLCPEDTLRRKYRDGLAALMTADEAAGVVHFIGFSDYGDQRLVEWIEEQLPAR